MSTAKLKQSNKKWCTKVSKLKLKKKYQTNSAILKCLK